MSDVDIKRMARSVERGQGLTANAKRNLWMVTLLNPQQNGVPAGLTPDECAEWALKHWCLNESGGLRKSRGALVAYDRTHHRNTALANAHVCHEFRMYG